MSDYLKEFHRRMERRWKGSLVKVESVKEPNAKEYLNKLAKEELIERVSWGWYWIPEKIEDVWDFLRKDKNFKVVAAQSAASLWNYDFVHRDVVILKVRDSSYGKALREFAKKRGWNIEVDYTEAINYRKMGNLFVEDMEDTVVDCLQSWAFMDAFAVLYANRERLNLKKLFDKTYWKRISGTNVRVRQVLEYGAQKMNELSGERLFSVRGLGLKDEFVKREIDDAAERVVELG